VKTTGVSSDAPVLIKEEPGDVLAYTPAHDFCTCGKDPKEAKKLLAAGLVAFVNELFSTGSLEEVLLECAWTKVARPKALERWVSPGIGYPKEVARVRVSVSS